MKKKPTYTNRGKRKAINPETFTIKVGIYYMGAENVALYLRSGTGGDFSLAPRDGSQAFIAIGHYGGNADWPKIVSDIQHEALEFAMSRLGLRWLQAPSSSDSHAAYAFHMTHEQMDEVAGMTGHFLASCLPDMARHFDAVVAAAKKAKPKRK